MTSSLTEEQRPLVDLNLLERQLFDHLTDSPLHIDRIAEELRATPEAVSVNLLSLEFKGLIRQLPGKMFIRR